MFSGRAQRCTVAACAPQPLLTLVQVDTHAPHKLVQFCAQYGHSLLVAASRSCVGCRSLLVLRPCMKRRVRVRQLACLGAASAVRLFVLPSGCLRPPYSCGAGVACCRMAGAVAMLSSASMRGYVMGAPGAFVSAVTSVYLKWVGWELLARPWP